MNPIEIEVFAQEQDLMKHIATLDAGCILIIATFIQHFGDSGSSKGSVAIALVAFCLSIAGALTMQALSVAYVGQRISSNRNDKRRIKHTSLFGTCTFITSILGLWVGLAALGYYALGNLL